jgi:hypothetical protein
MLFPLASALGIIPPSDVCDSIDVGGGVTTGFLANFPPHHHPHLSTLLARRTLAVFSLELAECLAGFEPFEVVLGGGRIPRDSDGSLAATAR